MRRAGGRTAVVVAVATGVIALCGTGVGAAVTRDQDDGPATGRYEYSFASGIVPGVIPTTGTGHTFYDPRSGSWNTQVVTNGLVPGASYTIVASNLDGSNPTEICTYNDDPFGSGGCERTGHPLTAIQKVVSRLNPITVLPGGGRVEPARAVRADHPAPPAPGEITFTR